MREIKFRGIAKPPVERGWYIGNGVFVDGMDAFILLGTWHDGYVKVFAKTVGQYTGLKDMDGREVYEGDIIQEPYGEPMQVAFRDGGFQAVRKSLDGTCLIWEDLSQAIYGARVIGNVFDEPEIMYDEGEGV